MSQYTQDRLIAALRDDIAALKMELAQVHRALEERSSHWAAAAVERDAANARAEALLAALAQIANMPTYGHNTHIRASMSAEAGQIANEAIHAAAREARG